MDEEELLASIARKILTANTPFMDDVYVQFNGDPDQHENINLVVDGNCTITAEEARFIRTLRENVAA